MRSNRKLVLPLQGRIVLEVVQFGCRDNREHYTLIVECIRESRIVGANKRGNDPLASAASHIIYNFPIGILSKVRDHYNRQ